MKQVFFLLSGEHSTLPLAELKAIMEAEGIRYKILEHKGQLVRVLIEGDILFIAERAALLHLGCLELFKTYADLKEIKKYINDYDWSFLENKTFVVRVWRVGNTAFPLTSMELERVIGALILKKVKAKVDLKSPQITIQGVLTDGIFSLGVLLFKIKRGTFQQRRPCRRPFFHPASMEPIIARTLVNLARCKRGSRVLDPFVGAGGIAIEALLIGCNVIGIDIDRRMVKGSVTNTRYFSCYDKFDVIFGDSTLPPLRNGCFDAIVTDPPYGRIASTHGTKSNVIFKKLLELASNVLRKNSYLVFVHPDWIFVDDLIEEYNFVRIEQHYVHVHAGLTRVIEVLRND